MKHVDGVVLLMREKKFSRERLSTVYSLLLKTQIWNELYAVETSHSGMISIVTVLKNRGL